MTAISALMPPLRVLTPINEVKEVLIHKNIRFSIVHRFKNMRYMANITDPDETPRLAASHLGLRYLSVFPYLHK